MANHPQKRGKKSKKMHTTAVVVSEKQPPTKALSHRIVKIRRRHTNLYFLSSFNRIMETELGDELKKYENLKVVVKNM